MVKAKKKREQLSSNMEDYLETIAFLKKEKGVARVKDIGKMLEVKNPSVTGALNLLSEKGYVFHERYGYVDLTPEGEKLAENIETRHHTLKRFLNEILDVDPKIAEDDACKLEHFVSGETLDKLMSFIEFVDTCQHKESPEWLRRFRDFYKTGKRQKCRCDETKKKP